MDTTKKRIIGLVTLIAYWYIAINGVQGVTWAWNMFVFVAWGMTSLMVLMTSARDTIPEAKRVRAYPAWISGVSDLGIALLLAAFGHFFYASMTLFQQILEQYYFEQKKSGEVA